MKISIITPSFNQVDFIEKTIQSVVNQKGDFELEYIVIDGKSTDGTLEILKKYEDQLYYVYEQDQGQSDAINKGLKMASGDIVAYLNSDDLYLPGALQTVCNYFRSHPDTVWAFGKCNIIAREGQEIRKTITAYKNFWLKQHSRFRFFVENYISQPAVFWRQTALGSVGFFDEKHHMVMDYHYWARLWLSHEPGYIEAYLASFRWYETSKSGSLYVKQFKDELRVAKELSPYPLAAWLHTLNTYKIIWAYHGLAWLRRWLS